MSDRIGGGMAALQAQRFVIRHQPGAVPTVSLPPGIEALVTQQPRDPGPLARLDLPVTSARTVVRGLGLDATEERLLEQRVKDLARASTEVELRQRVQALMVQRGYDGELRRALFERVLSYYRANREDRRMDKASFHIPLDGSDLEKAGGPFVGPRGGKWADPQHTIPWEEPSAAAPKTHVPAQSPEDHARHQRGLQVLAAAGERIDLKDVGIHPASEKERHHAESIREDKEFWAKVPEVHVPGGAKITGIEDSVKTKHVGPVVRKDVPLREGYAPLMLKKRDGSFVTVDGHHRMAMHQMLGSASFAAKVAPMPAHLDDSDVAAKAGPYIGPHGGKWADPDHTTPWREPGASGGPAHVQTAPNNKLRDTNMFQMKLANTMDMDAMDWVLRFGGVFRDLYDTQPKLRTSLHADGDAALPAWVDALHAAEHGLGKSWWWSTLTKSDFAPGGRVHGFVTLDDLLATGFMQKAAPAGGPFIGPRGGKWADAQHTIPYSDVPDYKMRVSGRTAEEAKDVAGKLHAGIKQAADLCKIDPPICADNLGIERADMPQIPKAVQEKFIAALKERGVSVEHVDVRPGNLKATQKEINAEKVLGMVDAAKAGKLDLRDTPIVVSSDNYVLDGHHRWGALLMHDPGRTMPVIKVGMPIKKLLAESLEFPGVSSGQGFHAPSVISKAGGPYIGPRGGKWADPQHTIPWDDSMHGGGSHGGGAAAPEKGSGGGHGVGAATLAALSKKIAEGALKGTAEQHVQTARGELDKHAKALDGFVADMKALAPKTAKVKARVKELDSAVGKLVRKPKYGDATTMQDLTGGRIILGSVEEVRSVVAAIKAKYEVVDEDDYITTPQGDYRSHHLIVRHNGLQKEMQIRTENQNTFAEWAHHVYKPETPEQTAARESHLEEINAYSKEGADYFWRKDSGQETDPPHPPPCTQLIHRTFGCLEF